MLSSLVLEVFSYLCGKTSGTTQLDMGSQTGFLSANLFIMKEKQEKTAWQASLSYLAKKALSAKELIGKLQKKNYSDEEIQTCIERLIQGKYLSDEIVAEHTGRKYAHKGNQFIKQKLKSRGISKEMVNSVVLQMENESERIEVAYRAILKKRTEPDNAKFREKAFRKLASAGFSSANILRILRPANPEEEIPID